MPSITSSTVRDYDPGRLVDRLLLRPDDDTGFRFAHALVRDAVYELLLKQRRRDLHRRAADWFADRDPILHAEHLDRAEAPEAAMAYLAAAKAQLGDYRAESARALLERGLAAARTAEDLFALSCLHGDTLLDLGATPEALQSFTRALELAPDDAGRCQAWLGLAACRRMTDDFVGAQADLELAEATATRLNLPDVLARLHFLAGNLCFPRGDIDGCLRHHGQSLAFARACGSAQHEAAALGGLGDADYVRGRMLSAQRHFERCLELCHEHGLGRIAAAHRQMLGLTRFFCNDVRGALADAVATARSARHIGQPRGEMVAHLVSAEMCANLMSLTDALAHLDEAQRLIAQLGAARFEPLRLNCLAKTLRAMGRRDEALPLLRQSVEASRETSLTFSGPSALGALALTTDDPDERRRAIEEGEGLLRAGSLAHNHFRFYRDTIDAALRAEEWSEAERLAEALATFAAPEPLPWTDFYAARGRVLAAWGRGERDEPQTGGTVPPGRAGSIGRPAPGTAGHRGRAGPLEAEPDPVVLQAQHQAAGRGIAGARFGRVLEHGVRVAEVALERPVLTERRRADGVVDEPDRLGAGLGRETGRELQADLGVTRQQLAAALDLGEGLARGRMKRVAGRRRPWPWPCRAGIAAAAARAAAPHCRRPSWPCRAAPPRRRPPRRRPPRPSSRP